MLDVNAGEKSRNLLQENLSADLAIVGGGMAGVCTAITAARAGVQVVLIQDRPVLGGNASSEVRLWVLGATSHMGNNNRWAREGGVIDEILTENLWRNPEGNPVLFDALLLEKISEEKCIRLLLNTSVSAVQMENAQRIASVQAYCSQNETAYHVQAKLFCDASGDGVLGYLSGAAFRMGAENREEFDEGFAPSSEERGLLGHSLYFYSRDTGRPVRFIPPSFALRDVSEILRYRELKSSDTGCRLWWLEYGGRLDTIHQTEEIKWQLWGIAYGIWDHIKNSGKFPEAENLTLEWVGAIPGKRESRRFEGEFILTQKDIVEQREHEDAVSVGGWAMDLHPADGVYSSQPGCTQWHPKGIYQIPFRCMYSRNIHNLFLAGRLISASHVAFGSSRVMATCAHNGQAVGIAAAVCLENGVPPSALSKGRLLQELQQRLLASGQLIPGLRQSNPLDLASCADVTVSSTFELGNLPPGADVVPLDVSRAMLLPLQAGPVPTFNVCLEAPQKTLLRAELWIARKQGNYTPELCLAGKDLSLETMGSQEVSISFDVQFDTPRYAFLVLRENPVIGVRLSETRVTGIMALSRGMNPAVATSSSQRPPKEIGVDAFDFWLPKRRPGGKNLSLRITPPLRSFCAASVINGYDRPYGTVNAWVASPEDPSPYLRLSWPEPIQIRRIVLRFDTDWDHSMESVLMNHPERVAPFCVADYRLCDETGKTIYEVKDNHASRNEILLSSAVMVRELQLEILRTHGASAAVFGVSCFSEAE